MQLLSYVMPLLALYFVLMFFLIYVKDMKPRLGTTEWIADLNPPAFSFDKPHAGMKKKDWLILAGLTIVYAAITFFYLGDKVAPQSFWKAEKVGSEATVDFGREITPNSVFYYPGLGAGNYTLEFSTDGTSWSEPIIMDQKYSSLFKWTTLDKLNDPGSVRYMRIKSAREGLWLGEMAINEAVGDGSVRRADASGFTVSETGAALFDEQDLVPEGMTFLNSTYFDEIYHARTAYENINNVYPYEITHPPLGKLILSLGIQMFGMTPFGWRFMGTLFGVLMLPFFYYLIKDMFGKTSVAFCATAAFAFDFMHFVQTRIATIDVYTVFFIILMYLFMWKYVTVGIEAPFYKTVLPLFFAGLFFGIGVAVKWPCIYAGAGLLALYAAYLVMRGRHAAKTGQKRGYVYFLIKTLAVSALFFLIIPFGIYLASYIPYARASGEITLLSVFDEMRRNQSYMFSYHSKLVDTHPYSAAWYTWLFDIRPILYYLSDQGSVKTAFGAFGNPFVWWGGLAALGMTVWRFFKKREIAGLFIIVGYLSQLLPWLFVMRVTFIYHYFPSTVFLCIALGYVFNDIIVRSWRNRRRVYIYTGVILGAFALFYPVLAGITVPVWYTDYFIKWLPSWPF